MNFYNKNNKENFINSLNPSYEKICNNIFNVSSSIEYKYTMDLYNFNLEQIRELMETFGSKTKDSARERFRIIFMYINEYKHLRKDRDNPLYKVENRWYEQFVYSNRRLISESELDEILAKLINIEDKIFFRLIFEGVCGEGYSELLKLKKNDINFKENLLRVTDSIRGERLVRVSDKCMDLLKDVVSGDNHYIRPTGKGNYQINSDHNYIIKRHGPNISNKRSKGIVQNRMNLLKEATKNRDLTTKVLQYSGMAYKAIEVSRKYSLPVNKFSYGTHWKEVADQFNLKPNKNGNYIHYQTIWKNVAYNNCEIIDELYGTFEDYNMENFALVDENDVEQIQTKRKRRIDSPKFRELAISAYKRCAISDESFAGILEACHIQPFINQKSNHIQNSILLRVDLHELFDCGYITIDENYKVRVSPLLTSQYYHSYNGKKINLPMEPFNHPSIEALKYNMSMFKDAVQDS